MATVAVPFSHSDPFRNHLLSVLSIHELGPGTQPHHVPRYEGPTDPQTDHILRTIAAIARRMYAAEDMLQKLGFSLNAHSVSTNIINGGTTPVNAGSNPGAPTSPPIQQIPSSYVDHLAASLAASSPSTNSTAPTMMTTVTATDSASQPASTASLPLVAPMGPLAHAAFESGMSAVEELRLLKAQVPDVARVCNAVARGDLSQKITVPVQGVVMVQLKDVINTMVDKLGQFAEEVTRVAREVGTEGRLGSQARVTNVGGTWKDLTDNVNVMAANLTFQVRTIAVITTAVARGDLTQRMSGVSENGEMLSLVNTINDMIDQLAEFADEVKNLAKGVRTEGMLSGQAEVGGVQGVWQEITSSVYTMMAGNLTT